MTKIDLVTGLLGAGKTTFIRRWCAFLEERGLRYAIIENEFGRAGVDAALLGLPMARVKEISGGCICCSMKAGFADLLVNLSAEVDRIVVEPSGVFTLGDFFEVANAPAVRACCEVGAVITVVDGTRLNGLCGPDEELFAAQLAGTGCVLANRTDSGALARLESLASAPVLQDDESLTGERFAFFEECRPQADAAIKAGADHSTLYSSTSFSPTLAFTKQELETLVLQAFAPENGEVLRLKGHLNRKGGGALLVNATPGTAEILEDESPRPAMLNVIGHRLNRRALAGLFFSGALAQRLEAMGARRAACLPVENILFDRRYRGLCEQNSCGNYGKNWTCPPLAGDIDTLMDEAKSFSHALVYQTVGELEDSYDFEGMMEAGARHNQLALRVREAFDELPLAKTLHLGAGGCRVCEECAKRTEEPCRHPKLAMASLETYGIAVSELAAACGMPYMNGQNTVTYFGAVLYQEQGGS